MHYKRYFLKAIVWSACLFTSNKSYPVFWMWKEIKIARAVKNSDLKSFEKILDVYIFNKKVSDLDMCSFIIQNDKNDRGSRMCGDGPLIAYIIDNDQFEILKLYLSKFDGFSKKSIERALGLACDKSLIKPDFLKLILQFKSLGKIINKECSNLQRVVKNIIKSDNVDFFKLLIENEWVDKEYVFTLFKSGHTYVNISSAIMFYNALKILKYMLSKNQVIINSHTGVKYKILGRETEFENNNLVFAAKFADKKMIKLIFNHPDANFDQAVKWIEVKGGFNKSKFIELFNSLVPKFKDSMHEIAKKKHEFPLDFNPKLQDNDRNNMMHLTAKYKNYKFFKKIRDSYPRLSTQLNLDSQTPQDIFSHQYIEAIKNKNIKALKKLMKNTPFVDVKDGNGDTLLHHAIRVNFQEAILLILIMLVKHESSLIFVKNNQGLYLAGFALSLGVQQAKANPNQVDWSVLQFLTKIACGKNYITDNTGKKKKIKYEIE